MTHFKVAQNQKFRSLDATPSLCTFKVPMSSCVGLDTSDDGAHCQVVRSYNKYASFIIKSGKTWVSQQVSVLWYKAMEMNPPWQKAVMEAIEKE